MFQGLRRSGLAALVLAAVALVAAASAQEASTRAEVRDQAQFFSSLAQSQAEARLAELNARHNVRTVIETTSEVPSDKADAVRGMTAAQRQKFFSDWTRQKAILASEPDVYVLINREPSHLRVRTSPALRQRGYSDADGRALTNAFLSGFRQKQYDPALEKAVGLLESQVSDLRADRTAATTSGPVAPGPVAAENEDDTSSWFSGSGLITIIAIVGLGLLVMVVLSTIFRSMSGGAGAGGFGGGGFLGSLLGTIGGVMAGSWLYDQFFNNSAQASDTTSHDTGATADDHTTEAGDYGGDFGGDDFGGGDFGGGDFGGGDF